MALHSGCTAQAEEKVYRRQRRRLRLPVPERRILQYTCSASTVRFLAYRFKLLVIHWSLNLNLKKFPPPAPPGNVSVPRSAAVPLRTDRRVTVAHHDSRIVSPAPADMILQHRRASEPTRPGAEPLSSLLMKASRSSHRRRDSASEALTVGLQVALHVAPSLLRSAVGHGSNKRLLIKKNKIKIKIRIKIKIKNWHTLGKLQEVPTVTQGRYVLPVVVQPDC